MKKEQGAGTHRLRDATNKYMQARAREAQAKIDKQVAELETVELLMQLGWTDCFSVNWRAVNRNIR